MFLEVILKILIFKTIKCSEIDNSSTIKQREQSTVIFMKYLDYLEDRTNSFILDFERKKHIINENTNEKILTLQKAKRFSLFKKNSEFTNYIKIDILKKLEQTFQECSKLSSDYYDYFDSILSELGSMYKRAVECRTLTKKAKKKYETKKKAIKVIISHGFCRKVDELTKIQMTIAKEKARVKGIIHTAINKEFIKGQITFITNEIVNLIGVDGLRCIYELEDIESRLNQPKSISRDFLNIFLISKPETSGTFLKSKREGLTYDIHQMTRELSEIDRAKLRFIFYRREIFGNTLEKDKDKRDIIQERRRYGLEKRLYYPNDIIKKQGSAYQIKRIIGAGTYSIVYKCKDLSTKSTFAVKILNQMNNEEPKKPGEIHINEHLSSIFNDSKKYLLTFKKYFLYNDSYCMIFDIFEMNLIEYLISKQETFLEDKEEVKSIMRQIFEGLRVLKSEDIIHRDIKADNILINPNTKHIKICDFGLSCFSSLNNKKVVGTKPYSAPEILNGLDYSFPVDIWAAGCVLFGLMTGNHLFSVTENFSVLSAINLYFKEIEKEKNYDPDTPFLNSIKDSLKNIEGAYELLRDILKENPNDRLTPEEALERLENL